MKLSRTTILKALGASRYQVLRNVSLPRTMPYFFASLKVAVTLAFVGTVLSETVAANRGIGTVMAVICDSDPARLLDAKAGQEMAAVNGLRIVQRVIGRIEDAAAAMAAMMARDPA